MRQPVTSSCTGLQNRAIKAEWGWDWQLIGSQVSPDVLGGETAKGAHKKYPFNQTLLHSSEECVCTGNRSRLFYKRTFLLLFSPSCSPARALISRSCHFSGYMPYLGCVKSTAPPFFPFLCLIASSHPCFLFSSCALVQAPKALGTRSAAHTAWIKADLSVWCVHTKDTHRELVFLRDIRSPSADTVSRSRSEFYQF